MIVSSADLCTAIIGEMAIFNAPKAAPNGNKRAGNMLKKKIDVNMKRLDSMIQSRLFILRDNNFIQVYFPI